MKYLVSSGTCRVLLLEAARMLSPSVFAFTHTRVSLFQRSIYSPSTHLQIYQNAIFTQRQKLIALHQSQIQAYHVAAKKALTEWANHVSLPEINPTIHDTLSSYVKSCRAVTIATRPIWREPTVSLSSKTNTNTKKELPVNEMAMNIIEERAKAAFEKQQQVSLSTTKNTTMGNIPEGDEEDEEGEVDEGDMNDDDVITEDAVAASTKTTTTTAVATKSSVPTRKNISLTKKSTGAKPNLQQQQQQQQLPPPSKRSTTKTIPIKKTNVTKTTTTTLQQQQHRNHPSQSSSSNSSHNNNNARGGGGGGRGSSSNNNSNTNSGGRGGGIRGMGGGRGSGSVSGSSKS